MDAAAKAAEASARPPLPAFGNDGAKLVPTSGDYSVVSDIKYVNVPTTLVGHGWSRFSKSKPSVTQTTMVLTPNADWTRISRNHDTTKTPGNRVYYLSSKQEWVPAVVAHESKSNPGKINIAFDGDDPDTDLMRVNPDRLVVRPKAGTMFPWSVNLGGEDKGDGNLKSRQNIQKYKEYPYKLTLKAGLGENQEYYIQFITSEAGSTASDEVAEPESEPTSIYPDGSASVSAMSPEGLPDMI